MPQAAALLLSGLFKLSGGWSEELNKGNVAQFQ